MAMALWILVIIGLDVCILLHYILKPVRLIASKNNKLVEELQRTKLEIAQISEEIRKIKPRFDQAI